MPKFIDLTNMRFDRLLVVKKSSNKNKKVMWECLCDCGNLKIISGHNLRLGITKSCGCLQKETVGEQSRIINKKHGFSRTKLYGIWKGMRQRCYNKRSIKYKDYGGRGISICDEWMKDFINFREWAIKNGYKENLSIDRKDVNGNYEPSNCRWATAKQQVRNTRVNHLLTYNGETKTIVEWSEIVGILPDTIQKRISRCKWPVEKALMTPVA